MTSRRVVLITGAGSGMGKAMVAEFIKNGDQVVAVDIDLDAACTAVSMFQEDDVALALQADVADPNSVAEVVAKAMAWRGRIDVLCNNAGIIDSYQPAHEVPLGEWFRVIAVNLSGPFMMAREVIPQMLSRGHGVIINTASVSSFSAAGGGTAYTASKHGVLGLTRQLTFDYGRRGIRVNAICPGATRTPLAVKDLGYNVTVETEDAIDRTPAGRWCEPAEIARLAVYLASDDADFIHGSAIVIDGGWLTAAREPF